jgi:ABC-type branched-subunit amino acid transport system ATPase component
VFEIDGLVVRFEGLKAIDGLSLSVPSGARVGVIGPNGSGKTTLINAISGLTVLDAGAIRLDGNEISRLAPHQIAAAGVARTFQTVRLFHRLTALDNVLPHVAPGGTGDKGGRAAAVEALERVGLSAQRDVIAGDLDAFAQRRLEIARVLAQRPRLLLVDEPTGGLSRAEAEQVIGLLDRGVAASTTILLVEHNVSAIEALCPRSILLVEGRLVADAATVDMLRDRALASVYFGPRMHQ